MIRYIEIRQAEGGDDSRLFVEDLSRAYSRMAGKLG
jgi:protein subunit release factor A